MWQRCLSLLFGVNLHAHNTIITSLLAVGNDIYLAGRFDSIAGIQANSIARWDGTKWNPVVEDCRFIEKGIRILHASMRWPPLVLVSLQQDSSTTSWIWSRNEHRMLGRPEWKRIGGIGWQPAILPQMASAFSRRNVLVCGRRP